MIHHNVQKTGVRKKRTARMHNYKDNTLNLEEIHVFNKIQSKRLFKLFFVLTWLFFRLLETVRPSIILFVVLRYFSPQPLGNLAKTPKWCFR